MTHGATPESMRKSNDDLREKLWPATELNGLREWRKGQKDEYEMVQDIVDTLKSLGFREEDFK